MNKCFTEYMDKNKDFKRMHDITRQFTAKLTLADSTILSIQASEYHYCNPKENTPTGSYSYYTEFEIGFPSQTISELLPYAEEPDNPTDTIYTYVPKELIQEVINKRGGIVG